MSVASAAPAAPAPGGDAGLESGLAAPPPPGDQVVVVRKGQTLSSIARRHYGSGGPAAVRRLRAANPELRGGDRLTAGDTLRVPPAANRQGDEG
ncbi:LysM peptidoglycan-binding domain-containing protein [bacterium]|nr:LysM peptidoglycan-binding domain-containing protein [bacterium]